MSRRSSSLSRYPRRSAAGGAKAGAGCLLGFGLVFGGLGAVFLVAIASQFSSEATARGWERVPCEILRCEISAEKERSEPFLLETRYRYEAQGRQWESDRYSFQEPRSDSYEKLALKRADLLASDGAFCRVNPRDPSEAVLQLQPLVGGLILFLPLLFVVIGGAVALAGLRGLLAKTNASDAPEAQPISSSSRGLALGWKSGAILSSVFILASLSAGVPLAAGPLQRMFQSRHWVETPCTILWSRVKVHRGDDSTTYSVDIFYEYEFNGQLHRSNRFQSLDASSSGRASKQRTVAAYPRGSRQTCHVNPARPEIALLRPGFTPGSALAFIPLAFFGAGCIGLAASLRARAAGAFAAGDPRRMSRASPAGVSRHAEGIPREDGPLVLRPGGSRVAKLLTMGFIALVWNGVTGAFAWQVIEGWKAGRGEIFLTLFLIPFVLVGAGLAAGFLYQLLALANPRPVLTLSPGPPRPGQTVEVRWSLRGRSSRVVRFSLVLEGTESATSRQGKNSSTRREVFHRQVFAETSDEREIQSGSARLSLPDDLVPSLRLAHHAIAYELQVKGDVPLWPDISDSWTLEILPPPSS